MNDRTVLEIYQGYERTKFLVGVESGNFGGTRGKV